MASNWSRLDESFELTFMDGSGLEEESDGDVVDSGISFKFRINKESKTLEYTCRNLTGPEHFLNINFPTLLPEASQNNKMKVILT